MFPVLDPRAVSVTGGLPWSAAPRGGMSGAGSLTLLGKEAGRGRKEPEKSQSDGQPQPSLTVGTEIMDAGGSVDSTQSTAFPGSQKQGARL